MNALKTWALGSLKALVAAVVAAALPVVITALTNLPAALSVPAVGVSAGAAVYAVRNR